MTLAAALPTVLDSQVAAMHYTVAMSQPTTHLFEISLVIHCETPQTLDLKFPVWTPGSYLVREYVRHLQGFTAVDDQEQPLVWQKLSKNHWQVQATAGLVSVRYRIFANELTVRTNHLDRSHGYFNPAAMFFRLVGQEQSPVLLTIELPDPEWKVSTPLVAVSEQGQTYLAQTFDELVDSPFEIGTQSVYDFEVLGKPHQLAIWGQAGSESPLNVKQFLADTQRVIETEADLFGGLPYERYLFLLHLTANAYGGLEHRSSSSLIYSRFGLTTEDGYSRFMSLVAHEFFHLWNVKRIRPKGLEVFDYDQENYTDALWFCEGTTSFYDLVIPFRAGLYDAKSYLEKVSEAITKLQTTPGRLVQPLSESSFDAWIKLYRPDSNSRNAQVSYYLKGEVVSFLLDLLIRQRSGASQQSLDDVMRQMWQQFGKPERGFTREDLKSVFESAADADLTDFWSCYIDGTDELPYGSLLEPFGLRLSVAEMATVPYLGFTANADQGTTLLSFVEAGSPAEQAGLEPGDELLAINGYRIRADQIEDRLQSYHPGQTLEVSVFHQDVLCQRQVVLADPVPTRYELCAVDNPSPQQRERFRQWLGIELATL